MLGVQELLLGRSELIVEIYLVLVGGMPFENHEFLVVENEVGAFVEGREDGKGFREFEGPTAVLLVSSRGGFAEFNEAKDLLWQGVADAGDRSGRSAVDKAVIDLGIDSRHEDERFVDAGDVLGSVAQGTRSPEFLEADEGGEFAAEGKEEIGFGFEAVVGRVVNDGREVTSRLQDLTKVVALGSGGTSPREDPRNDHEAIGPHFAGVGRMGGRDGRVLRSRPNDRRDSCFDEAANALHALLIGQQGPIAHRSTVNYSPHPGMDEIVGRGHESIVVDDALGIAGGHESGNTAFKNRSGRGHERMMG